MIFHDFRLALAQLGDARFLRVVLFGVLLALALLALAYALLLWGIEAYAPGTITIPMIGPVGGIDSLLGLGSLILMLVLSVFLMVPVASVFISFFVEDVADAVEDRHYPGLPDLSRAGLLDSTVEAVNFLGLLIAVNLFGLILYALAGPFSPLVFWVLNGLLLGQEYFTLVASRRLGRKGAKALRKAHRFEVWFAGILLTAPLALPLVNLVIPVLGVATFTHLYHRLAGTPRQP